MSVYADLAIWNTWSARIVNRRKIKINWAAFACSLIFTLNAVWNVTLLANSFLQIIRRITKMTERRIQTISTMFWALLANIIR